MDNPRQREEAMTTPTDVHREEHRVMLAALDVLERAGEHLDVGDPLPNPIWDRLLHWLRTFADLNHHAKEERSLFPAMVKAGLPSEGGPIAVMLEEHAHGRALIQSMDAGPSTERTARVREYVGLLRAHIAKENEVLFPLADAVLDNQAVDGVHRDFETVGIELGVEASLDHAEASVAALAGAVSVPGGPKEPIE
jgi:hemerythrin-like domain-containing protein